MTATIDFAGIKARIPLEDYCAMQGIELRSFGSVLQAKCPIHQETNGRSFTVYPEDYRWYCYGACSRGGDLFDLHAVLRGISNAEAARELASDGEVRVSSGPTAPKASRVFREPAAHILTDSEVTRMNVASHRLATDEAKCAGIARARGWDSATVRQLALDGDLGIEDDWILFGYSHGLKARRKRNGGKQFRWLCGNPFGQCWRQSLLTARHRTIVIAEGEPDAIRFMDAGYENDGLTLILGMPGVGGLPKPEPFAGKEVLLAPDTDEAGRKAIPKLVAALAPFAASISLLTPDEAALQEACA